MFKFAVLFALVACSFAAPAPKPGYLAAPTAYHVAAAPVLPHSYASTYNVAYKQPLVAAPALTAYAAPSYAYAAHAAPVAYAAHAAPLAYAAHAAPLAYTAHAAPLTYIH